MNINELKLELDKHNVPRFEYSILPTSLPDERLCLVQLDNEKWQVFFSERGNKFDLVEFNSEDEACKYFLNELK